MTGATKTMKPSTKNPAPADWLRHRGACSEGYEFAMKHKTMAEVWAKCPRADWMLWMVRELRVTLDPKAARLFACACVRGTPVDDTRTVWDLLKDPRSRTAVEVAERFANGKATAEELAVARQAAAYAAAYAAADAYAAHGSAEPPSTARHQSGAPPQPRAH
jgi:hypothetical protein